MTRHNKRFARFKNPDLMGGYLQMRPGRQLWVVWYYTWGVAQMPWEKFRRFAYLATGPQGYNTRPSWDDDESALQAFRVEIILNWKEAGDASS